MKEFRYRITIEPLDQDASDTEGQAAAPLIFEASNHDDILKIVTLAQEKPAICASAASFVLGLKLLSDV